MMMAGLLRTMRKSLKMTTESKMTLDTIAKEVYDEIMDTWTGDELRKFFSCGPRDIVMYHNTLGRHIRNKYDMWGKNKPPNGIHPDDYSMDVIELVWRSTTWPPPKKA